MVSHEVTGAAKKLLEKKEEILIKALRAQHT